MSLLTLRGLFERLRAPSQSQKVHFSEKMKLKKWHQNSWHWQKSAQSSEIFVTSCGICQSVGVSSRKGEIFLFCTKMVPTKRKPVIAVPSCCAGGGAVNNNPISQKMQICALTLTLQLIDMLSWELTPMSWSTTSLSQTGASEKRVQHPNMI